MGIQVVAHTSFCGKTGYNAHSQAFFTNLNKHIPVRIRNYSYTDDLSSLTEEQHKMLIEQKWNDPPFKIGRPYIQHAYDTTVNIVLNESHHYFFYDQYKSPKIAYNVWESTKQLPTFFKRILQYDQFWCPTKWQRQCTIDQGYPEDRVKVVPEGVDGNIFKPSYDLEIKKNLFKKYNIPHDAFTFMIFGRWDYRKSTSEMIRVWYNTFGRRDNCYLIVSVDNQFASDKMKTTEERLKHHKLEHERIKVLHFPPRDEYIKWLQHGSCLLSCSRSEGWNLPLMESLACGTPSICSNWGGHLEFADGIAYKVNVPKELPPKEVYLLGDDHDLGVWGEPDFDHLQDVMKDVYNDFDKCQEHALKMSDVVREKYTWENAAKIAAEHIKELAGPYQIKVPANINKKTFVRYFDIAPSFDGLEMQILLDRIFPEVGIYNYEVHAFEPCRDSFDAVKKKFLDYNHINFHKLAIWKEEESLRLYHSIDNPHGNSLFDSKFNIDKETYEDVKAIPFSKWLIDNDIDLENSFNILRYNIEGSELELFRDLDGNDLFKFFDVVTGIGTSDLKKIEELIDKVDEFDSIREKHKIFAPNFDPDNWQPIKILIDNKYNNIEPQFIGQKKFKIEFGQTDDGFIKVTFEPLDHFDKVLARITNSFGEILYQDWFEDLNPEITYWVSANHPVNDLKSAFFEIFDEKNIPIQSSKKEYIRNPSPSKELVAKNHFVIKEENKQKVMNVQYSKTDDGCPKITFNPLHNKKFYNVTVIVRDLYGQNLYQSKFDDLNPRLDYWMTIGTKISALDGIRIQFIDDNDVLLQQNTKRYQLKEPIVSFVTSFYNAEQFVDEIADSILNQTFEEWEWIVTDDWSDDNTKQKVKALPLLDKRIRYVKQKEKQEIYWNPHRYSKGEIICTIDADDVVVPKTGEVLVQFYNIHPEVQCIHVNANFHEEEFAGNETFKNSSFARMDKYDSILQKHHIYLNNESGYERVGYMFGTIRSYRNPGEHFDFNDGDFKLGKHEDLAKLLRLEEIGTPLYLNRTLYKVRMRSKGNNSGHWHDYGGVTEFEKMREIADKRRTTSFKHLTTYDSVREELNSFLYSDLNDEKERRRISCLGFGISHSQRKLIQNMYFDHEVDFEKIDRDYDYVFAIIRSKNDIEYYEEMTKDLRKAQVQFFFINDKWEPSFYDTEDGESYFKLFKECKDWLVQKRGFMWTTYLYKYCSIIYNLEKNPVKLNLGCGNDIKPGYINIDRYNNTGQVDMKCDIADLPFADNTVDEIFTAHVFEHIMINDVYAVLEEWYRALKLDGKLVMKLPNLENEVRIWLDAPPERKWFEVHRIFGAQSHDGNTHFSGHNPESLKWLIERFGFTVETCNIQNVGFGDEIKLVARKSIKIDLVQTNYINHFVDGPFLQIQGDSKDKSFYIADFLDPDNNASVHQQTLSVNSWTRPHRKYFTNWLVRVNRNGKLVFEHKYDAEGKNILISFDTKSLGDSIAWVPKVEEFRLKHKCNLYLSTFWNNLFEKAYPDIKFVSPGSRVENLYASYLIGCWEGNLHKNKVDWRTVPLQHVCSNILGLEHKEIICDLGIKLGDRPIKEKYVTMSEFSTFQCKFWNHPSGWKEVVNYLNDLGYKVVSISKEETKLENVIKMNNRPIEETITNIAHSEFFIGISSGPSWLAWALRKPTVLISGYSSKWAEFESNIERVINENVCHGCFNKTNNNFERGNWMWCPFQKGTPRQFECSKTITPQMVISAIQNITTKGL